MTTDARLRALGRALGARRTASVTREDSCDEAAVALILRPAAHLEILFIERPARESDPWSGQIALPGGRRTADDADLLATVLREAEEETGIRMHRVGSVLGRLDELLPGSTRLPKVVIAPYVITVPADAATRPDAREVSSMEWIPLSVLRDPGFASELRIERDGTVLRFPSIVFRDYVIWGITHRIVTQFLDIAQSAGL